MVLCLFAYGCPVFIFVLCIFCMFFFFKQKTAYEMRISDWSSDVCSSDLEQRRFAGCHSSSRLDSSVLVAPPSPAHGRASAHICALAAHAGRQIGRASCRERVCQYV